MKVRSKLTVADTERAAAALGIRIASSDHPIYREPPCVALFSGNLVPGIVPEATPRPPPTTEKPAASAPGLDPLAPPLRAVYWDDESYEEARGYWNTHVGRVLALRRQYTSPKKDAPPAKPGQST